MLDVYGFRVSMYLFIGVVVVGVVGIVILV